MKLLAILRFELAYQARRPWPWLIVAAIVGVSFLMTRDGTLAEALYDDFFVNSPFAIAKTTVVGSLLWLMVGAAVAGEAGARDVATGMYPLVYAAPLSKADYLGGRFLAALLINALLLLAVQVGILIAVYAPGIEAQVIGPFRPAAYLTAYAFISLPNALAATALQFALASWSGRAMAAYLGSLLLFFVGFFVTSILIFKFGTGKLLDPIGVHFILSDLSHDWTTIEKSWRLLALEGIILRNRLVWISAGVATIAFTFVRFRFAHRVEASWWRWPRPGTAHAPVAVAAGTGVRFSTPVAVSHVARSFGLAIRVRQALAIAWISFRTLATSWAGIALLGAIPLLTVLVVIDQMSSLGVPLVPTTALVLGELTAPLSAELSRWVIVPLLIVYFAGELVWRERDTGVGEICDAMAGSAWVPFLGKFLGLGLVLAAFMASLAAAGILAQSLRGYHEYELALYLTVLFGLQLPDYLLFALLALVVHVVVDQKYVGHLVAVLAYVFIALAPMFGVEHPLLVFGAGPGWSYTEMRGFGATLGPWAWFKLYWLAWALLLAVVARLLWGRGLERGLGMRLRLARQGLTRPSLAVAAIATALILTLGGFNFYNTNVLNEYRSSATRTALGAEYERRYGRYAADAQPDVAETTLRVEIHPQRRAMEIRGTYRLVNGSTTAIDSIHVATVAGVETSALAIDRPGAFAVADEELGHRIYALEQPLLPGDSLRLDFEVHAAPRGFAANGPDASIMANGTFFTSALLPAIGYQRSRELIIPGDRRAHGLVARPVIPSLYDADARKGASTGSAFEAIVGTEDGQVAVAPGVLRRTWTEGGRRYFHYVTDAPIGNEFAFFSADYEVLESTWSDPADAGRSVAIRILHHPAHGAQVERMLRSIRASLEHYTKEFGPYRYGHLTFVERPGNGTGMHADASVVSFSEGSALLTPSDDSVRLDLPFAIVAHEMGHQWGVPYAAVEGAPVMSESLAWYFAMQVVEAQYGRDHRQRLLRFMRQPHPYQPIRRGEPLLRGLDPYMSYRKGPFVLHALSEYIGEDRVNAALRHLLEVHRTPDAPSATTLDLYRGIQAVTPDSLRHLPHDLFEVNTLWNLGTNRVSAEETDDGTWRVTLDVRARKYVFDSAGVETDVPMNEWVEVGVFGAPRLRGNLREPLYLERHRIRDGEQSITVTVPRRPVLAGLDPYHVLDWEARDGDDNVGEVKIESGPIAPRGATGPPRRVTP